MYCIITLGMIVAATAVATPQEEARRLLRQADVSGGLVVHVGCDDGKLTAALRADDRYVVHGLDQDPEAVRRARDYLKSKGLYGDISVETWDGRTLPYVDNLLNLVVCEAGSPPPGDEMMRVLCPGGVALIKRDGEWTKQTKTPEKEIDDWKHYLHDSGNNAVAEDRKIAPPYHVHWIAEPKYSRHHEHLASISALVSAGGRIFYIVDEGPTASILLPPQWRLVARDAYSGVVLWKREIPTWEDWMHSFRWGPVRLPRRLVATENRVYATLGLDSPLVALDASTGKTVHKYEGTAGTEEVICHDGILFAVTDLSSGKEGRKNDSGAGMRLVSLDAESGKTRWKQDEKNLLPLTLAAEDGRVFYQDAGAVVCRDAGSGERLWRAERAAPDERPSWSAPTLVVHDGVVLSADRRADLKKPEGRSAWNAPYRSGAKGKLIAFSAKDGDRLWSTDCAEAFHAPIDVFVVDGLVWVGQDRMRHNEDFTEGYDLHTGEVKKRISTAEAFKTTMGHHRCYRNKATSRYILAGRTGVEFINTNTGRTLREHWVRGTCQYGIMPCNGLLYVPPHSCACFIEAKLAGFFALSARKQRDGDGRDDPGSTALERGPAYGFSPEAGKASDDEWPTYRHDPARSGHTGATIPANLEHDWQAEVGGKLSSPVVADGLAIVASTEDHTVHALDAKTGKEKWAFTAGGGADSPPTVADGRVVFGCADGYVYCLRASDGELIWRFRAARANRRVMAQGKLESVWPLHGSTLVRDGAAYCAAGRTSYLDSGIYLYKLDLATGKKLTERRLYSREPETGDQPEEPRPYEMPGALPDILSADDELVYMRQLGFEPEKLEPREAPSHLWSPAGFLDDTWWHRTYWIFGKHFYAGYIGWYFAGREVPAGRLLVHDDSTIYGYGYKPRDYRGATGRRYHLFAIPRKSGTEQEPADYRRARRDYPPGGKRKFNVNFRWTADVPMLVRAMVLAGDRLFMAGPPEEALKSTPALKGKKGAMLRVAAAENGRKLAEYKLDALPAWDGMAVANGRLYLSTRDGRLICMKGAQ